MSDSIKIGSVALDCPDAGRLAAFYAEITGGTPIRPGTRSACAPRPAERGLTAR
jgi:Glyoxalase-like domain